MSDLEARVRRLEDIEEIRRLKHYYYATCIDRKVCLNDDKAIAEMISRLADDVEIDFTYFPVIRGKEMVAKFFKEHVPVSMQWCQHRVTNGVIDVNGDTAHGEWYFDCPAQFRRGASVRGSGFVAGRYIEDYVRVDGVWKWKRIVAQIDVLHKLKNAFEDAKFVEKNH